MTRGAPTIPRVCLRCGGEFLTWPYCVRDGKGNYCSPGCFLGRPRAIQPSSKVTVACPQCGQSFETWPYRLRGRVPYCSERCKGGAYRKPRVACECAVCGRRFAVTPGRIRAGPVHTCSAHCRGIWLSRRPKQSTTRNSTAYKAWRAAVYARDNYTCQHCQKRGGHNLHAHHVETWTAAPARRFEVANGMTLCNSCHAREHATEATLLQASGLRRRRSRAG